MLLKCVGLLQHPTARFPLLTLTIKIFLKVGEDIFFLCSSLRSCSFPASTSMAWKCSGTTNTALVGAMRRHGLLRTEEIVHAFQSVDRSWFVPEALRPVAFEDRPLPIGYSVTISAPHMHAIMAEILAPFVVGQGDKRVLDVGSGSGFLTCVIAGANPSCRVVGLEHVPELVESSTQIVRTHFPDWLASGRVQFVVGDGRKADQCHLPFAAFDAIHVGAAASEIPVALTNLLAPNGCLVIPVGGQHDTQELYVIHKRQDGSLHKTVNSYVQFVPLTSIEHQLKL